MNRVLVSLVLLSSTLAVARAAPRGPQSLLGEWENRDRNTRSVTRMHFTLQGGRLQCRIWGRCHPEDCDWGIRPVELYGRNVSANLPEEASAFTMEYPSGFATKWLTGRIGKRGEMVVDLFNRFQDRSGRSDYHLRFRMVRKRTADFEEARELPVRIRSRTQRPPPKPRKARETRSGIRLEADLKRLEGDQDALRRELRPPPAPEFLPLEPPPGPAHELEVEFEEVVEEEVEESSSWFGR